MRTESSQLAGGEEEASSASLCCGAGAVVSLCQLYWYSERRGMRAHVQVSWLGPAGPNRWDLVLVFLPLLAKQHHLFYLLVQITSTHHFKELYATFHWRAANYNEEIRKAMYKSFLTAIINDWY